MARVLKAILFDLDNTLYHPATGLQEAGDRRFNAWIVNNLGLSADEADALRVRTWRQYGATARGLQAEYGVDPRIVYEYAVDRLEPKLYLRPQPDLARMLAGLNVPRHLFTNATAVYAAKVLEALGIARHFDRVFDIEYSGWLSKPEPTIYARILADLRLAPAQVALVEDNPRNLRPAQDLGMLTVLVGDGETPGDRADLRVPRITDLSQSLAEAGVRA